MKLDKSQISRNSPMPLTHQLYNLLKTEILEGRIAPGEKLPSESALIAGFGVSRVTVREAIAFLNDAGLTQTVNGKGSFVTQPSFNSDRGLWNMMTHERQLGRVVTGRLVDSSIVEANSEVAHALAIRAGTPVVQMHLHRALDGNQFSDGLIFTDVVLGKRMVEAGVHDRDVIEILTMDLDIRISKTDLEISAINADKALAKKFKCEPGTALLRGSYTMFDFHEHPILHGTGHFNTELLHYRFTVRRSA